MRAERAANLIYNGGKTKKASSEATVTVEFDNSSKLFSTIKEKTLTISRTVKQSGQSKYRINGEVRTRQQILDLLRNAKIDPDGHNIILQGDIIQFTEMKSVERKQVIEEASGIAIYEDKKRKCLLELEKVETKLKEANIILTEREANLRELKKERDQAKRYKEIQKEIVDFKATHLHLQIKDKKQNIEEVESKIKKEKHKLESIEKTTKELQEEINNFKENIKDINKEIEEKGEKEQLILRKKAEDLRAESIRINSRMSVCNTEVIKIKQRDTQLKNSIQQTKERITTLNRSQKDQEKEKGTYLSKENSIQNKIKQFKSKHGISEDNTKRLEGIDQELNNLAKENLELEEERRITQQQAYQTNFILKDILSKINNIKGEEGNKLKIKEKGLEKIKINLGRLIEKDSKFAAKIPNLRAELHSKSEELARLQTRQAKISEFTMSDVATSRILEIKKQIKGIYGTVSELGEVDPKYSLALEVAAGSRTLSIVVEDDSVAHKCIKYLKENKLGVATFLPLNKIRELPQQPGIQNLIKQKGVEGKAIDLVRFDTKFKAIFSHVFGSTIITKDLSTSRKIGVGTIRMTTLDGDLVEKSGAMVGGFRQKRRGLGFKEKDSPKKIGKLENEISKIKKEILNLEQDRSKNENEIESLREDKANLEGEVIQKRKVLGIDQLKKLEGEKEHFLKSIKEEEQKLKVTLEQLKQNNKSQEELKKQLLKSNTQNPEINKKLEEFERERLNTKDKVNEINSNIKGINSQIQNLLEPEINRIEKILKQQEKEIEMFKKESQELQEKGKQVTQELKITQKEESKYQNNLKELIKKRYRLNERISNKEKAIGIQNEREKAYQKRVNNLSIDRAKVIAESEGLEKEFEEFKEGKIKRGFNVAELKLKIRETERELNKIGNVNLRALEIYEELEQELQKLIEKLEKLQSEKDDVMVMMQEIENKKIKVFMKTYKAISTNFKRIFNELTTKGEVHMLLEDKNNPFEGGVDIQIRLTSKKFMDIKSLSGGEKTIAALAFIFAIQEYQPSPFYLLDEVDAALDKKNAQILTNLIQKYASKAQYIVISHNDGVITEADQVYGVSMQEGVSKVISLKV